MPSDNESPLKSFFAEFKLAHPIMKHFLWLNHHYNIEQNLLYWLSPENLWTKACAKLNPSFFLQVYLLFTLGRFSFGITF